MAGIVGLMKEEEGEVGSDVSDEERELNGAWIDNPFMFFGRRGAGDVIGLAGVASDTLRLAMPPESAPKGAGANDERGISDIIGESGEEDGEASERSDESVQESVVVGDDSTDSVAWVDVLLLCLCEESGTRVAGLSSGAELPGSLGCSITSFGSMTVTRPC